ncbi:MAG: MvdC family ATP-grasp ribosomal peptide maturase [Planctomycetota bacterium]
MASTRSMVLLLTHSGDYFTVDRVAEALEERGARPYRLNTDLFPSRVRLAARLGDGGPRHVAVAEDNTSFDPSDVSAVWARRVWPPELPEGLDPALRDGCARESTAALHGFFDALAHARWVNPWSADRDAENKARQLRVASALGLRVPRTLITNDAERARAFYDEVGGRMVAKMLTPLSISMGKAPLFVRTSRVEAEDLEHAEQLRHSPMVFQEHVEKRCELRVACVGGRLFAGAIDASGSAAGKVDWRAADVAEARWERASVPADVGRRLAALCDELGLVYGAVDLIQRPDGEHVFLEINPGGEWGMLERDLDLPISAGLADALLDRDSTLP